MTLMNQKQRETVNTILKGIAARGRNVSGVEPVWLGDRGGSVALCIGPGWPIILVGPREGQNGLTGIETVGYHQHPYSTNLEAAIYADRLAATLPPKEYKPPKGRRMPESYQLAREKCAQILKQRQQGAVEPASSTVKTQEKKAVPAPRPQSVAANGDKAILDGVESRLLNWQTDERTAQAATAYPLPLRRDTPAPQFGGCFTSTQTWNDRVIQPATWKDGPLLSSPEEIIRQFRNERYTQALALVVSWGGMGRRSRDIYGEPQPEKIEQIEQTLREFAQSIQKSRSISDAWRTLTGRLGWSAVMTSKTLHFLCRSLGFEQNPPVAIDNAVVRQRVWPVFRDSIPIGKRPDDWEGNTLAAYCRYMTAILTWADQKRWTTTQVETTIFDQFGSVAQTAG